jgi:hypothetical protein
MWFDVIYNGDCTVSERNTGVTCYWLSDILLLLLGPANMGKCILEYNFLTKAPGTVKQQLVAKGCWLIEREECRAARIHWLCVAAIETTAFIPKHGIHCKLPAYQRRCALRCKRNIVDCG